MNYFRCTVGGSGGKLKLTVTCDSGFAGATISCTDGTTTLTATCPSSSPYTVIFKIPNGGTWIVSSGSSSTTVVIPDTATLHQIPTGSTATPVNVIQTWLHCANIWDKTYTTINQVLADTSTLLALISSNNAADYMARSTNWASSVCANQTAMGYIGNNNYCANKLLSNSTWLNAICNSTYFESVLNVKVPTMTADNAPYGQAFGNYNTGGGSIDYYFAFNGNDADYTCDSGALGLSQFYCGYTFTESVCVKRVFAKFTRILTGKIQASNDGFVNDIHDLATFTGAGDYYNPDIKTINLNNNDNYLSYRFVGTSSSGTGSSVKFIVYTLQFYGRA